MFHKSVQFSPEDGFFLVPILQTEVFIYGPSKGLGPARLIVTEPRFMISLSMLGSRRSLLTNSNIIPSDDGIFPGISN